MVLWLKKLISLSPFALFTGIVLTPQREIINILNLTIDYV